MGALQVGQHPLPDQSVPGQYACDRRRAGARGIGRRPVRGPLSSHSNRGARHLYLSRGPSSDIGARSRRQIRRPPPQRLRRFLARPAVARLSSRRSRLGGRGQRCARSPPPSKRSSSCRGLRLWQGSTVRGTVPRAPRPDSPWECPRARRPAARDCQPVRQPNTPLDLRLAQAGRRAPLRRRIPLGAAAQRCASRPDLSRLPSQPLAARSRAKPSMPAPPMPTRCTRRYWSKSVFIAANALSPLGV